VGEGAKARRNQRKKTISAETKAGSGWLAAEEKSCELPAVKSA